MRRDGFILIFISLLFVGCSRPKAQVAAAEKIHKVTLSTGGCFGRCPYRAAEINENHEYYYFAGLFAQEQGYFTGTVPDSVWEKITRQFYEMNFRELDTAYQHTMDDQRMEAVITYGQNQRKHIMAQSASLPDSLTVVFEYILNTARFIPLTQTDEEHQFDTRIHLRK